MAAWPATGYALRQSGEFDQMNYRDIFGPPYEDELTREEHERMTEKKTTYGVRVWMVGLSGEPDTYGGKRGQYGTAEYLGDYVRIDVRDDDGGVLRTVAFPSHQVVRIEEFYTQA